MLEHLIDLEVAATGTALDPDARRDHIEARREMFHSICGTTSAARIDCALRAADLDGVEKCDRAP